MDTVTHGLTGWLIGRAVPSAEGRKEATAATVVGSLLPDADNVASLFGSEIYIRIHRGLSHSFLGVGVTSLLVALVFYRFGKWKDLKKLYLYALVGQLSHIALDLLNSYGTQIFQPFSDARVSFDLLFIVDLAFSGIVLGGLLLSRGRPAGARAALLVLLAYVGLAAGLHGRAERIVREAAQRGGVRVEAVSALPSVRESPSGFLSIVKEPLLLPVGPLSWNGFVDDGTTYLRAEVDPLGGGVAWKDRVRRGGDLPEVRALSGVPDVRTYLWFARFPVVRASAVPGGKVLTFRDLRYESLQRRRPFQLRVIEIPGLRPRARWG